MERGTSPFRLPLLSTAANSATGLRPRKRKQTCGIPVEGRHPSLLGLVELKQQQGERGGHRKRSSCGDGGAATYENGDVVAPHGLTKDRQHQRPKQPSRHFLPPLASEEALQSPSIDGNRPEPDYAPQLNSSTGITKRRRNATLLRGTWMCEKSFNTHA